MGLFPIVDPMALQNWTLDVFARRDGWVEIDFAAIPGRRGALPWLYSDEFAGKIGAPVLSRAYFTPEQIRASTRFADSVIDRLMPPDVAAKRFSRGAPTFISMPSGIGDGKLFSTYTFAPHAPGPNLPESIEFGLGGCLDVSDAGPALLGRGATWSVQDFRAMMRALDTAAYFSSQYASPPKPDA